jgi:hypothetical protein
VIIWIYRYTPSSRSPFCHFVGYEDGGDLIDYT